MPTASRSCSAACCSARSSPPRATKPPTSTTPAGGAERSLGFVHMHCTVLLDLDGRRLCELSSKSRRAGHALALIWRMQLSGRTCPAQRSTHAAQKDKVVVSCLPALPCRLLPCASRQRAQAAKASCKQAGCKAHGVPPPSRHHGGCLFNLRSCLVERLWEGSHALQRSRKRRKRPALLLPLLLAAVCCAAALAPAAAVSLAAVNAAITAAAATCHF